MFGLYRMRSGAKIVQSSFDYATQSIGPYTLPIHIEYAQEYCNGDKFYKYKYYQALLQDEHALAVFNVNNYCLCVVCRDYAYETDLNPASKLDLLEWKFPTPICTEVYQHVGYIKSYHDCLAVTQFPTFLIRALGAQKAYDFEDEFAGEPLVDPPLSLYRELVNSEAQAVYFDTVTKRPRFLFK